MCPFWGKRSATIKWRFDDCAQKWPRIACFCRRGYTYAKGQSAASRASCEPWRGSCFKNAPKTAAISSFSSLLPRTFRINEKYAGCCFQSQTRLTWDCPKLCKIAGNALFFLQLFRIIGGENLMSMTMIVHLGIGGGKWTSPTQVKQELTTDSLR